MKAIDGGMELSMTVSDFDFPIYAYGALIVCAGISGVGPAELGVSGWVGLNNADVDATLDIDLVNGQPKVELSSLNVQTSGLYVDLDCGSWTFSATS